MTAITSTPPKPGVARRTFLLLAAVFVLPFVVGTGLFLMDWRPDKFGNHGELVQPPRMLPESGLAHIDGRPLPTADLQGRWLLAMPAVGACDSTCARRLEEVRNVHVALNKEQKRVQRVLFSSGVSGPALAELQGQFPELLVVTMPDDAPGAPWHEVLDARGYGLYVVDPLGNVMMRYPEPTDMRGALKDLERLLKYSWVPQN